MRILVIAGYGQSLINFRGPLLKAMVEAGCEVIACAPTVPKTTVQMLAQMGVEVREIPLDRTGMNPARDLATVLHVRRLCDQVRPDTVLSYTIKPVIYGSLAAQSARVPMVSSIITGLGYTFGQESLRQRILGKLTHALYKLALRANSVVFFQNPDNLEFFVNRGLLSNPEKAVVINGSGVDLEHYMKTPIVTEPLTFLLIARLLRDKGIYEYVEAARGIQERYPHVRFQLVGPFDSNPSAISPSTVKAWQAEGIIEYLGETDDVRPFIANASVYVLPSYREGTPRTVLEAMAMGRPIITTDAPGCRETVVQGKNGFLVPVGDSHSLASAMERFILQPELIESMGEESYRIAREK